MMLHGFYKDVLSDAKTTSRHFTLFRRHVPAVIISPVVLASDSTSVYYTQVLPSVLTTKFRLVRTHCPNEPQSMETNT